MRIEVKGRNLPISEDLREHVEKRFQKIARSPSLRSSKSSSTRSATQRSPIAT
jgi:ribosome-associated translation inhibitor RaiA